MENDASLIEEISSYLPESELRGLDKLTRTNILTYMNGGTRPAYFKRDAEKKPIFKFTSKQIVKAFETITNPDLVMYGGGKDSGVMMAGKRLMHLKTREKYGKVYKLSVAIGVHPGMIDCYENIDNSIRALGMVDDPDVEIFYIVGKDQIVPYQPGVVPVAEEISGLARAAALVNGHIWSGAGRRTFCDSCNQVLSGWIVTALAYTKAILFSTGDSLKELTAQINGDVPIMAKELGITLPKQGSMSDAQYAFTLLELVGREYTKRIFGNDKDVEARSVDAKRLDGLNPSFVSFFSALGYESKDRLKFLTEFLGFSFDSLMFSFTESDCGNPALMCHLYGLIAEHAYGRFGSKYEDGIKMYVEYALDKMKEKGFPDELIDKMKARYENPAAISEMRKKVEDYAKRAYNFEPEHLTAMVYAPFTENGRNLSRYLKYLGDSGKIEKDSLRVTETEIRTILKSDAQLTNPQEKIYNKMHELTGLTFGQMRHVSTLGLAIDNFDVHYRSKTAIENLRQTMDNDSLYLGTGWLRTGHGFLAIPIRGR